MSCRSSWFVACTVLAVILGACGGSTGDADGPASVTDLGATPNADDRGRVDADPYDGVAGTIVLTPAEVAYRDQLGLTDLQAHDAFGYSCAIFGVPERFDRFANQPAEETTP